MVKKQLLTLAAVVGILACGACFMPDLPEHKPASPPMPPALASVHMIAIHVEDGIGGNLFDPSIMSNATARNFNQLWQEFPVRAEAYNALGPSNAALRITVLRKTTSCKPGYNGNQFCSFEMIASFTLTDAEGRILISRPQENWNFNFWQKNDSLPNNLNSNPFRQSAAYALAMTAGGILCYPARSK